MSSGRSAASSISTRSTRSAGNPTIRRSPATCRARACSRRCSRSWKAPSLRCLRKAAASTRSRSSCRSTRPTSCSSAAARSPGSRRSSPRAAGRPRSASAPRSKPPTTGGPARSCKGVEPEDLLKFGLIPEFIGRVPVIATLDDLDEEALMRILTEPKNALVKQYQRLFEMEDVQLTFADEAMRTIAKKAIERKTGARGLRSIMEGILLDTMFELPEPPRRGGGRDLLRRWSKARRGRCASTPTATRSSERAPGGRLGSFAACPVLANLSTIVSENRGLPGDRAQDMATIPAGGHGALPLKLVANAAGPAHSFDRASIGTVADLRRSGLPNAQRRRSPRAVPPSQESDGTAMTESKPSTTKEGRTGALPGPAAPRHCRLPLYDRAAVRRPREVDRRARRGDALRQADPARRAEERERRRAVDRRHLPRWARSPPCCSC